MSHGFLQLTHSMTGLPWFASIPLAAAAFRLLVGVTFQRWTFIDAGKKARLSPLLLSWKTAHAKELMDASRAASTNEFVNPQLVKTWTLAFYRQKQEELYKRWNIRWWHKYAIFAQFPFWLAVLESLRRMTGMHMGLLGVIQLWVNDNVPSESAVPLEPSMATEGALWFPDLLAADPYYALPVMLSSILLANINFGWKKKTSEEIAQLPAREAFRARAMNGLRTGLNLVALSVAPTCVRAEVPAGLLLFWISSSGFATLQTVLMRKRYVVTAPRPCRDKGIVGAAKKPEPKNTNNQKPEVIKPRAKN